MAQGRAHVISGGVVWSVGYVCRDILGSIARPVLGVGETTHAPAMATATLRGTVNAIIRLQDSRATKPALPLLGPHVLENQGKTCRIP